MASRRRSTDDSTRYEAKSLDCIFACGICQATVPEIYSEGQDHGLHSGDSHEEGLVTKIWIADCSHVFCGKHLEGGGIPFHPAGVEHAKVVCPVCVELKGDRRKHRVFWIRGLRKGQYDNDIPDKWFICPPEPLDDGLDDALRFQYCNLERYAVQVTKRWKSAEMKLRRLEKHHHDERKLWEKEQSELKAQLAVLEKKEAKLDKWEKKRNMINHYLGAVTDMEKEIKAMRAQLLKLGFQVPAKTYAFEPQEASKASRHDLEPAKSSATLVGDQLRSSSSQKRKHPQQDYYGDHGDQMRTTVDSARPMMPPPMPVKRDASGAPPSAVYEPPREVRHRRSQHFQHAGTSRAFEPHSEYLEAHHYPQLQSAFGSQRDLPPSSRAAYNDEQHAKQQVHEQPARGRGEAFEGHTRDSITAGRDRGDPRALPFRSTQENAYEPGRHVEQYRRDHQDADMIPPQQTGLLAMPPRRPNQFDHRNLPREDYTELLHSRLRAPESPRVRHFEASYGTMQQQSGSQAPREMQGFHDNASAQTPGPSSRWDNQTSRSSQRRAMDPSASVLSPFFQSQSQSRRQPPPTRGSEIQHRYTPDIPRAMAPTLPPPSSSYRPRPPPSKPIYQRAPRLSDYAYQPARPQAQFKPPSSSYRTRITLPTGTTRIPLNDTQDPQLARIQGARGAAVPRQNFSRQSMAATSTPTRGLFSAGGPKAVYR